MRIGGGSVACRRRTACSVRVGVADSKHRPRIAERVRGRGAGRRYGAMPGQRMHCTRTAKASLPGMRPPCVPVSTKPQTR